MNDVAVIGAGPAGIAASIYLKRTGFDVNLFEKNKIGGLLLNAHLVENYPGFPDRIKGEKLCSFFEKHLKKWNIDPIQKEVNKISYNGENFILRFDDKKHDYKSIIVATGTDHKELDIPIQKGLVGNKIFYEIKDLLNNVKPGDTCCIIGSGDAAFDYSLNLAERNCKVNIFFRSKKPRCLPLLEERVKKSNCVELFPGKEPKKIILEKEKPVLIMEDIEKKSDYIIIACGRKPNDTLLTEDFKKSNIPGLYVAGDVRTGRFRQAGIAIGEGIHVAMCAEAYLRGLNK